MQWLDDTPLPRGAVDEEVGLVRGVAAEVVVGGVGVDRGVGVGDDLGDEARGVPKCGVRGRASRSGVGRGGGEEGRVEGAEGSRMSIREVSGGSGAMRSARAH